MGIEEGRRETQTRPKKGAGEKGGRTQGLGRGDSAELVGPN